MSWTERSSGTQAGLFDEIVVDSFAGGGGASTGIEKALGRPIDIAINHDAKAVAMHEANHPWTRHFCESVWDVDPEEATGGRPVALAWFSPDCTHFSRAKGTKPRKQEIRGLAWVVLRWAARARPRVIMLENVEEFATWGPLRNGRPCPDRRGSTFRRWTGQLRALGYELEWRTLVAADFGAPTKRKRLYLIARRDGEPIVWPEPTHGPGQEQPWRTAAEIIDWSLPCPSIFLRKEEAKAVGVRRPLAEKTLKRVAAGVQRFVVDDPDPYVVQTTDGLAGATLIQTGYGERPGQAPRVPGLGKPLGTVVAGGSKHALVAAFLAKHYGGVVGHGMRRPIGTVTAKDHHSLVSAFLTKYYGTANGQTVNEPLHTVTARDRFGLVVVAGLQYRISDIGMRMLSPRELYTAQGFPDEYRIEPEIEGRKLGRTDQIRMAGNSVCPAVAQALVAANFVTAKRTAARPAA